MNETMRAVVLHAPGEYSIETVPVPTPGHGEVLVLNAGNSLVQYVTEHGEDEHTAKICEQLYDLASLSHGSLSPERMTKFIARSNEIMGLLVK